MPYNTKLTIVERQVYSWTLDPVALRPLQLPFHDDGNTETDIDGFAWFLNCKGTNRFFASSPDMFASLLNSIGRFVFAASDIHGRNAFITIRSLENANIRFTHPENAEVYIDLYAGIRNIVHVTGTTEQAPYISLDASVRSILESEHFVPLRYGDLLEFLNGWYIGISRQAPQTFDAWAEIEDIEHSVTSINIDANPEPDPIYEITCNVRYDDRIRAGDKAVLDGRGYMISSVKVVNRYRVLQLELVEIR